jgi:hypothetical protein
MVPRAEAANPGAAEMEVGAVETVAVVAVGVDSFAKLYCNSQTCRNQ